jgi:signal transduction histidine kinase
LTYSRIARAKLELHPVALESLIQDIIQHYPEMQPPRAIITLQGSFPKVMAHEPSLAQAISNLLSNAVKFVEPGVIPEIVINSVQEGRTVRMTIIDNGIGIRPEHRTRLFGMFERAIQDSRYEGTGIGLAIVRKAIERMGGKVGHQPDTTTGSLFWIELPAASFPEETLS